MINAIPAGERGRGSTVALEAVSLLTGAAFTAGLLIFLSYFGHRAPVPAAPEIEDLHVAAIPFTPPLPPVTPAAKATATESPLTGIEIGASDSPVKIAAVPPELDILSPASETPAAKIQTLQIYSGTKPKMDVMADPDHVFQQSEVDRIPTVLSRTDPVVPVRVRNGAVMLRVTTMIVVDTTGAVSSVRIWKTSGNAEFDAIIVQSIQDEWSFTPAIKRGRKVRCLLQQSVTVRWGSASPFSL